jgi:hypothetical protein
LLQGIDGYEGNEWFAWSSVALMLLLMIDPTQQLLIKN